MRRARSESANQIEEDELAVTQPVFDVIAEDPEVKHVANDVHPRCVHEHGRQQSEIDRFRAGVHRDRDALSTDIDRLRLNEVSVVRYLEWNRAVSVDEPLATAQLEKPDNDVDRNKNVGDVRSAVSIEIVVA